MNKSVVFCVGFLILQMLQGCLNGDSSETVSTSQPRIAMDFPRQSALGASVSSALAASQDCLARLPIAPRYSTDGGELNFHGLALGTTSAGLPGSVEFRLNANTASFDSQLAPSTGSFFYWQEDPTAPAPALAAGTNSLAATAVAQAGFASTCASVVRGSSYQAERALQYVFDNTNTPNDRWFLIDAVKRAVLEVNAPPADSTTEFLRKWPFSMDAGSSICGPNRDQSCGSGVGFERPVDLAFDSVANRFLVIDRDLKAVIEVVLGNGNRNQVVSLAGTDPVAITVDDTGTIAYVVDSLHDDILSVDLAGGTFTRLPDDAQELQNPRDIVFQPANGVVGDRLLVTDRRNVDGDNIVVVDVAQPAPGYTRSLLEPPEIRDADPDTEPEVTFFRLSHLALDSSTDTLYVFDGFPGDIAGLLTVDVSGDTTTGGFGTDGARSLLSVTSLLPTALTVGADGAASRLLMLDNELGALIEVDAQGEFSSLPGSRNTAGTSGGELVADVRGLSSLDIDQLQRVGSSVVAFSNRGNALVSLSPSSAGVAVFEQVSNIVEGSDPVAVDASATLARAFRDVRTLNVHPDTAEYYFVDAMTDTVLVQPATLTAARLVASPPAASGVSFANPIAASIFSNGDDSTLYVLDDAVSGGSFGVVEVGLDVKNNFHSYDDGTVDANGDGLINSDDMDSVDVSSNRSVIDLGNCTALSDPTAMVYYETGVAAQRYLLIAESSVNVLHVVDLESAGPACASVSFAAIAASEIVDIEVDTRSDDATPGLFMLDKANQAVFTLTVDVAGASVVAGPSPLSDSTTGSDNLFISANAMAFDRSDDRLYVLDDVINSIYVVDLRARDASGEPAAGGTVTGQRFVRLRGVAMNCDPAEDDDGDGNDATGTFTNATCGLE